MNDRTANDWDLFNAAIRNARGLKPRGKGTFHEQTAMIEQEILKLKKTKDFKDYQLENILGPLTDEEKAFLQWNMDPTYAAQVAQYNPELVALQEKYNKLLADKNTIDSQMINLNDAKATMEWAVSSMKWSIEKAAESSKAGTALNKAIQIWGAQGTAWMQWATAWQLNKLQSEISNKFAPTFSDIEAQRQAWLWQAAQIEAGIPAQLSAIAGQNVTNAYNASLIWQGQWGQAWSSRRWQQRNSTLNLWQWDLFKQVYDPKTGKYKRVGKEGAVSKLSPWMQNVTGWLRTWTPL